MAYFLVSIEVYLATYAVGGFHLSFAAFGPTELRLLLMAGNIALLRTPYATLAGKEHLLFDVGGRWDRGNGPRAALVHRKTHRTIVSRRARLKSRSAKA